MTEAVFPPRLNEVVPCLEFDAPSETMDKLTAFLTKTPDSYVFQCVVCGKTRQDPKITDPGVLYQQRTCAQSMISCSQAALPLKASEPQFLPGSLVIVNYKDGFWPAIVEYSVDEVADYAVKIGEDEEDFTNPPYAFFVTFIGLDTSVTFGGWFSTQRIHPLLEERAEVYDPKLQEALEKCYTNMSRSLRERLLDLSFIAAKLRLSGFVISDPPHAGTIQAVGGSAVQPEVETCVRSPDVGKIFDMSQTIQNYVPMSLSAEYRQVLILSSSSDITFSSDEDSL